jgi:glycosyltransferase involved in cell wall biosynthesis
VRTLFISQHFPEHPARDVFGYSQRVHTTLEAAARLGPIDLLYYVREGIDRSPESMARRQRQLSERWNTEVALFVCPTEKLRRLKAHALLALFARCLRTGAFSFAVPDVSMRTSGDNQVRALEHCLARRPDVVIAHNLGGCAPLLRCRGPLPPVVFDLDGIEHDKYTQYASLAAGWRERLRYRLTLPLLLRSEREGIALARRTFLCADRDCDALRERWGLPGLVTVPNAVELKSPLPPCDAPTLMFLGTYDYWPNADGAEFLITRIWPQIQDARPDARLIIAGPRPERIPCYSSAPGGVDFTGFVEDLDKLYANTSIVLCPLRAGCGTRLKILEAAAYGKPIVSTTLGAEGIELVNEREILLRDDAEGFAGACLELLGDRDRCRAMGEASRFRVAERYRRDEIIALIIRYLKEAVAEGTRDRAAGLRR